MTGDISTFLSAGVRTATPLALAAFGELLVERSGLINIGLEGAILAGAFGALLGASAGGLALGYLAAMGAGTVMALIFAFFVLRVHANQIITGTALTLLSFGVTGSMYRALYGSGGAALRVPTSASIPLPFLSRIPVIGSALFDQPLMTYIAYGLACALSWWLYRTHAGLALRAVGEEPEAAAAAGIRVTCVRASAILAGGVLAGLAGATLVLAHAGTFVEGMSAGRGFVAIAIVILGRWTPVGVALAALIFGAASALQFAFQAMGWDLPYQLFLAVPYALTLAGLAGGAGRSRGPAALNRAL